jgi:uncharacterized protein with PIN domain
VTSARFVTDSSLDLLARRLRMLGYDVTTVRTARLEELFELAEREGRTVLTLSARHPRRWRDVPALTLRRGDEAASLKRVALEYEPSGLPFTRCPLCNVAMQRRHPLEASGEVPGRVLRSVRVFHYCPHCGKWYWEGTHVVRVRAWLEAALGRALPSGEPAGDPPAS